MFSLPLGDSDSHQIYGFFRPILVNPTRKGISIGSAFFAGLMNVTNRQTDVHTQTNQLHYCVCTCSNKPLSLAVAAMRLNNKTIDIEGRQLLMTVEAFHFGYKVVTSNFVRGEAKYCE